MKNKLKVFNMKSNDINGGKCYFICQKNLNLNQILKKLLCLREKRWLENSIVFNKFFKRINKIGDQLRRLIKRINLNDKKFMDMASTKGNVLLQYFGLTNKYINFI